MVLKPQDDLIGTCYDGVAQQHMSQEQFGELFCKHCRQPQCIRAKWGRTKFDIRVQTAMERIFGDDRIVSDLSSSAHKEISERDFPDASHKAKRLLIAAKRNDWSYIPDEPPPTAEQKTTETVDRAVQRLAQLRGQTPPTLPDPSHKSDPEPEPEPEVQDDTVVEDDSSDDDEWTARDERRARRDDREAGIKEPPRRKVPEPNTQPGQHRLHNTPNPMQGVMVDGSESKPPKPKPVDTWAPRRSPDLVEPGATVRLGGGSEKKDE